MGRADGTVDIQYLHGVSLPLIMQLQCLAHTDPIWCWPPTKLIWNTGAAAAANQSPCMLSSPPSLPLIYSRAHNNTGTGAHSHMHKGWVLAGSLTLLHHCLTLQVLLATVLLAAVRLATVNDPSRQNMPTQIYSYTLALWATMNVKNADSSNKILIHWLVCGETCWCINSFLQPAEQTTVDTLLSVLILLDFFFFFHIMFQGHE